MDLALGGEFIRIAIAQTARSVAHDVHDAGCGVPGAGSMRVRTFLILNY